MAKNLFNLVICYGDLVYSINTSEKICSTLKEEFFFHTFHQYNDYVFVLTDVLLFHQFFLSIIDSFNVFSYNKVIAFIQPLNLVNCIFNFEMYSFVMRIARDVIKLVELVKTTPML